MFEQLAKLLKQHHYKNGNGCWLTDYAKIGGLRILASDTNGTSGLAMWRRCKVYFYFDHPTQLFKVERD